MKKIVLHGCYNTSNFGDLLLLDMVTGSIQEEEGHIVLTPWISDAEKNTVKATSIVSVSDFLSADVGVFGGGGYFVDVPGNPKKAVKLLRYAMPAFLWRMFRIPYAIVGVGVGPELSFLGGKIVKFICSGAKLISVRDEASKRLLIEQGVNQNHIGVVADLAICLQYKDIPEPSITKAKSLINDTQKFKLGIHLSIAEGLEDDIVAFADILNKSIQKNKNKNIDVYWFFDHAESNLSKIQQIVDNHENYYLVKKQNHWVTAAFIGQLDSVITTKLHVGIVAFALGVLPFGISNHGKTKRFYEQIDRSDYQTDYNGDFSIINRWIDELFSVPIAQKPSESESVFELKNRSKQGYTLISKFIMDNC